MNTVFTVIPVIGILDHLDMRGVSTTMQPTPKIRPATREDYDAICALFAELDRHHVTIDSTNYCDFEGPRRPRDRIAQFIDDADKFLFVALSDERVVGFTNGLLASTPPFPMFVQKHFVSVINLMVCPSCRGRGIAKRLMESVDHWGKDQGTNSIRLDVIAGNDSAMRFYENLGFRPTRLTLERD